MKPIKLNLWTIATALVLSTLSPSAGAVEKRGGTEADYAEIQKFHDRSVEKFNAGDLEGSVGDYLERLRVLHTKNTEITGRERMHTNWGKSFATSKPMLISEIQEMEVQGSGIGAWAYMVCRFSSVVLDKATGKPKSTEASAFADGRYIALMTRTADGWKVLLDIDNGAPGAAPDLVQKLKAKVAP